MRSVILSSAARYTLPVLLVFSVFVLLRGHNEPGGGFVGGLVAAAGVSLYALAEGVDEARRFLRASPRLFFSYGLLIAVLSAIFPLLTGDMFMQGLWDERTLPGIKHLGTPLFFDIGVYLVVIGVVVNIVFVFFEND